jgi:hypothetical protein
MLIDEPRKANSAMPLAAIALDFRQVELALQLGQRD